MGLSQFAGVFSRAFVVGFFMPAFFALAALSQLVSDESLPSGYRDQSGAVQLAIVGGISLLLALLLSGAHYHVIRLFEGYPLQRVGEPDTREPARRLLAWLSAKMVGRFERGFDRRSGALTGPKSRARTVAARELNRYFPSRRDFILPTRLGNTIRAFETHPNKRYELDGVTAWPRIATLLGEAEGEALSDAEADFAFFLNFTTLVPIVSASLVVDLIVHPATSGVGQVALVAGAAVAGGSLMWMFYAASVGAAVRWGMPVRAAFDMHRLELYAELGLRRPKSDADERKIAKAATRCMLYGESLDESVRDQSTPDEEER